MASNSNNSQVKVQTLSQKSLVLTNFPTMLDTQNQTANPFVIILKISQAEIRPHFQFVNP